MHETINLKTSWFAGIIILEINISKIISDQKETCHSSHYATVMEKIINDKLVLTLLTIDDPVKV